MLNQNPKSEWALLLHAFLALISKRVSVDTLVDADLIAEAKVNSFF
jgi:hypothetical protein